MTDISKIKPNDIILSGMRPTGSVHMGHYIGVISNWLEFQKTHKCYFFTADWHALTSYHDDVKVVREHRIEYVRNWLACGIDPKKAVIYNQSDIKEVLYLNQFFLCMTPPGWADRSPSWKDHKENNFTKKNDNLGFYTYPILQTADIAIVKGNWVPVGEDQVTHIEMAREITRKFNRQYGTNLPEPEAILTPTPKLLGTDGTKMSSSKGNYITLKETEKGLQKKINGMKTDDQRGGIEKPGNPQNCSVFDFHKIFSPKELQGEIIEGCTGAKLGCGECKQKLGACMKPIFMPISEKIHAIKDDECLDVLKEGNKVAKIEAEKTWAEIEQKVRFNA